MRSIRSTETFIRRDRTGPPPGRRRRLARAPRRAGDVPDMDDVAGEHFAPEGDGFGGATLLGFAATVSFSRSASMRLSVSSAERESKSRVASLRLRASTSRRMRARVSSASRWAAARIPARSCSMVSRRSARATRRSSASLRASSSRRRASAAASRSPRISPRRFSNSKCSGASWSLARWSTSSARPRRRAMASALDGQGARSSGGRSGSGSRC